MYDERVSQDAEIQRLSQEVLALRREVNSRPTVEAMERLRSEWQTSEELFDQSQRDNEQKHNTIEGLRNYIRALESKLEDTLGDDWKDFCSLPAVHPPFNPFAVSTPLPKPGLRSAASIKRAHRHSRGPSAVDHNYIRTLREEPAGDAATPAAALRKLDGIHEARTPVTQLVDAGSPALMSSAQRPLPLQVVDSIGTDNTAPLSAASTSSQANPSSDLVALIQSLPSSLSTHLDSKRLQDEMQSLGKQEAIRDAISKLLDETEQRAQARETRLQALLAEAKAFSQPDS